ncbi:hypothetical protein GCM10011389_13150 [Pontibacillus salipaludis]|uniref:Uncharacterized protein n=1 Tax=Pontibacillus salipaludis TaxID=1697394 RepID=A0ABQ1PXT7_9BACI|nr:hypothetical protein GCM10011389_13150 [Pontibacillus salipaludis]
MVIQEKGRIVEDSKLGHFTVCGAVTLISARAGLGTTRFPAPRRKASGPRESPSTLKRKGPSC